MLVWTWRLGFLGFMGLWDMDANFPKYPMHSNFHSPDNKKALPEESGKAISL
jgi:hypothetical protein